MVVSEVGLKLLSYLRRAQLELITQWLSHDYSLYQICKPATKLPFKLIGTKTPTSVQKYPL
jgi:hypothetical protein